MNSELPLESIGRHHEAHHALRPAQARLPRLALLFWALGLGSVSVPAVAADRAVDPVTNHAVVGEAPPTPQSLPEVLPAVRPTAVPAVTRQPVGRTLTVGDMALFAVAAQGEGLTYQWSQNGRDLPGQTQNSLQIRNLGPGHAGQYRVAISNPSGTVNSVPVDLKLRPTDCVVFEDLVLGALYRPGSALQAEGIGLLIGPFTALNGLVIQDGYVRVENGRKADRSGQELLVNNATAEFQFAQPLAELGLRFGVYGGSVSLSINGDSRQAAHFADLHGKVIGNVLVGIQQDPTSPLGHLSLIGRIASVAVGGQELYLDDACWLRLATGGLESADLDRVEPKEYGAGSSWSSGNARFTVRAASVPGGTSTNAPKATLVQPTQLPGALDALGGELVLQEAAVGIDFGKPLVGLAFDFACPSNARTLLEINGVPGWSAGSILDLDGQRIGNVLVAVREVRRVGPENGGWAATLENGLILGRVLMLGAIQSLAVGGQALDVDNLTPDVVACTRGDLTADGRITTDDAVKALRMAVGLDPASSDLLCAGDVSGNGVYDVADAVRILRAAQGIEGIPETPVGDLPVPIPRPLRVGQASAVAGGTVEVPVELVADPGTSIWGLSFTLSWDPALLSYQGANVGGLPGPLPEPLFNGGQIASGHLGLALAGTGTPGWPTGTSTVARLRFTTSTAVSNTLTALISFTDHLALRQVVGSNRTTGESGLLPVAFTEGQIRIVPSVIGCTRGDLTGDGKITNEDAERVLRMVAGLDPAPRDLSCAGDVSGNGVYDVADAVRILRAARGTEGISENPVASMPGPLPLPFRVGPTEVLPGGIVEVPVELVVDPGTSIWGLSFTLSWNPARLRYQSANIAQLPGPIPDPLLNVSEVARGSLGLAMASTGVPGWPTGTSTIVRLRFSTLDVFPNGTTASFTFTDQPTRREVMGWDQGTGQYFRTAPQPFAVSGSTILAPDGSVFIPIGANVGGIYGGSYGFDSKGKANAYGRSAEALAWGWNTVRLNLYVSSQESWMPKSALGDAEFRKRIAAFVDEYTAKRIVVILEAHDYTNQGFAASSASVQAEVDDFWNWASKTFKSNTYVWFNCANEPVWKDSATWMTLQRHLLALVRNAGAGNIFVADLLNGGQDAGWEGAKRIYDPSMGPALVQGESNIVFGLHAYGGIGKTADYSAYIDQVQQAGLAILVGEFGRTIDGSKGAGTPAQNIDGVEAVLALAIPKGIGALWWNATHDDKYSLKASGNAFYDDGGPDANLSNAGHRFWLLSHPVTTVLQRGLHPDGSYTRTLDSVFVQIENSGTMLKEAFGQAPYFDPKGPNFGGTACLWFDLKDKTHAVPGGQVLRATLRLWLKPDPSDHSGTLDLQRILDPDGSGMWEENPVLDLNYYTEQEKVHSPSDFLSGIVDPLSMGSARFKRSGVNSPGVPWSTKSVTFVGALDPSVIKSAPHLAGTVGWIEFDVTDDIRSFQNGMSNLGWVVRSSQADTIRGAILTGEWREPDKRPQLTISTDPELSGRLKCLIFAAVHPLHPQVWITGPKGQAFVLQTSTNLLGWSDRMTNSLESASFVFTDEDASLPSAKFYRTRKP